MPEGAIEAARQGIAKLGEDLEGLESKMDDRERLTKIVLAIGVGFAVLVVTALIYVGVSVRQNTEAIKANRADDQEDERRRIAQCESARADLSDMAVAIVNGSADGLADLGHGNPRNQTPEAQALVDVFAEQYRNGYMASVLAEVPRAEDCR